MVGKIQVLFGILLFASLAFFAYQSMQPKETVVRIISDWNMAAGEAKSTSSEKPDAVELTIYQVDNPSTYGYYGGEGFNMGNGLALIKETRKANFPNGLTLFQMKGTAQYIDSTSLNLKDLTDASTSVLEQNYDYDLVNQQKIMEKYVDKEIIVKAGNESIRGTLLSASGGLVLSTKTGIVSLQNYERIEFPVLPEGLITKPTINWMLNSNKDGEHQVQASYLASGLNWHADYVAVVNKDDNAITDLQGWVSIKNNAGATFENAKLKLVAGEINLVRTGVSDGRVYSMAKEMVGSDAAPQFTQQGLFEYHLYTLQRPTTLKDNQDKQITLLTGNNIPVVKEYVFDSDTSSKVQVKLNFDNKKENGLGMPMPKGKVRVYKADSEEQLQFLGEDQIDHTPEKETIRLFVGNAFDIIAEKKQTNFKRISDNVQETSYQVDIRNHKAEAIEVTVVQNLYGDWEIVSQSQNGEKENANKNVWKVKVGADGSATLIYTIRTKY